MFLRQKETQPDAACFLYLIGWEGGGGLCTFHKTSFIIIYFKIQFYDKELLARILKSGANTDEQTNPNSRVSTEV